MPNTQITYEKVSYLLVHFCEPIGFHCYVVTSKYKFVFVCHQAIAAADVELSIHSETATSSMKYKLYRTN